MNAKETNYLEHENRITRMKIKWKFSLMTRRKEYENVIA